MSDSTEDDPQIFVDATGAGDSDFPDEAVDTQPIETVLPAPHERPLRDPDITKPMLVAAKFGALGVEPPPDGLHVRVHGVTDVGLVREHNEDNFLLVDLSSKNRGVSEALASHRVGARGSIFAVCDGMGGAAAGEVASQMAVDTVYDVMLSGSSPTDRDDFARRLVLSIEEAAARIFAAAKMDRSRRGMGTTATVCGLLDQVLFVGQVGDSRAYVLRGGELKLVTKDQSLVNQLIEAGQLTEEEAEAFEHNNIILQALGTAETVAVDLTFLELRRGDRLLVCSDGLSGLVHADLMREVLSTILDPAECCTRLVEMARNGGGHDNITVIVADFDGTALSEPKLGDIVGYRQYPLPPAPEGQEFELPARDVSIKEGGPKPGADVKRDPSIRPARQPGLWTASRIAIVAILVALLVAAALYFTSGSASQSHPSTSPSMSSGAES